MKLIVRLLLLLVMLLAIFTAYLALRPAPIDPVAWEPPPPPAFTGPLAPNERLAAATLIGVGEIDGPEDVETDAEGRVYGGTNKGEVVRVGAGDAIEV
ncbi:MAG TPA: hypothetical protein VIK91_05140, partial [Nannocystis sp.]